MYGILSDFKETRQWLSDWLFYRRQSLKLSLAIRLADMKQRAFNKRYHVMLLEYPPGRRRLVSVNRDEIEVFRRKRWIPRHLKMIDLAPSIFYSTPISRNNRSTPQERRCSRKKYLAYAAKYMKRL